MRKFYVDFAGGQSRDGFSGCNYLLVNCVDRDGDEVELYAEYIEPDADDEEIKEFIKDGYTAEDIASIDDKTYWFDNDKFDDISYLELKAEILRQAEENNVDPETLVFDR